MLKKVLEHFKMKSGRDLLRISIGTAGLLLLFILVPSIMFWGHEEIEFLLDPITTSNALPVRWGAVGAASRVGGRVHVRRCWGTEARRWRRRSNVQV